MMCYFIRIRILVLKKQQKEKEEKGGEGEAFSVFFQNIKITKLTFLAVNTNMKNHY
jgi:hypothetical protein